MPEEKPEKKIQSEDDSLDTPKKKKKNKTGSKDDPLDTPKKKKKKMDFSIRLRMLVHRSGQCRVRLPPLLE